MKNYLTVAKYTFSEIYRSKILISLLFLAFGLLVLCYVASEFGYGAPDKIALDVGLGIMSLSNVVISLLIGSTLIGKEIEQKTLYMILSKPISRASFLMGKITGLSTILLLNTLLLGITSVGLFLFYEGQFSNLILWTWWFSFLESLIVLFFAILFSLITNTTLTVLFTIVVYTVGHALNETSKIIFLKTSEVTSKIIETCFYIIPNFYRLNLKDLVLYKQSVPTDYLVFTQGYALLYLVGLTFFVIVLFNNKNLD